MSECKTLACRDTAMPGQRYCMDCKEEGERLKLVAQMAHLLQEAAAFQSEWGIPKAWVRDASKLIASCIATRLIRGPVEAAKGGRDGA